MMFLETIQPKKEKKTRKQMGSDFKSDGAL